MPRGRKPDGPQALSGAERQAAIEPATPAPPSSASADPPTGAPARSDGTPPSPNSSPCRPTTHDGSTLSPTPPATAPLPRPYRPSSSSSSTTSSPSNRRADSAAIKPSRPPPRCRKTGHPNCRRPDITIVVAQGIYRECNAT